MKYKVQIECESSTDLKKIAMADEAFSFIFEYSNFLRQKTKYNEDPVSGGVYEEAREEFYRLLNEQGTILSLAFEG